MIRYLRLSAALCLLPATGGCVDRRPTLLVPAAAARAPFAAVYLSGDGGLGAGLGVPVMNALAAHGVATLGFGSPHWFEKKKTRAEVDAFVAGAIRRTLAETGATRIALIGQSYGADVLHTGAAALPATLRAKVVGIVLIVPGSTVYFRADPTGQAYRGRPDHIGVQSAGAIDWTPVTCIYGVQEPDSLCPELEDKAERIVALPGGHAMRHDARRLSAEVLSALGLKPRPA